MQVQNFLRKRRLPDNVAEEIRTHCDSEARLDSDVDGLDIFMMLSRSLQIEVARHISWEAISKAKIFKGCQDSFLESLSVLVREVHFHPGTVLFRYL